MKTLSSKVTATQIKKIDSKYKSFKIKDVKNQNLLAFYKTKDLAISIFKTGTLLLQGEDEAIANFGKVTISKQPSTKKSLIKIDGTIGMDEVGTGDYFGPVVTCACYLDNKNIDKAKALGVNDSKKILDSSIRLMAKKLKELVKYEICICMPKTYNSIIKEFDNSNIVKAITHNTSLSKLTKKLKESYKVILDQFVSRENYYKYLEKAKQEAVYIDVIEMKAESKYLAVACASVLARDAFLTKMEEMAKNVKCELPRGAVKKDQIVKVGKLINKKAKLSDYAKLHFEDITNKILN